MANVPRIVTQTDLREKGLSNYLVRQIFKDLEFSRRKQGLKLYATSDVIAEIENKLAKPRTRRTTRETLQSALAWLRGESNVIKVDFLKNLSLEERLETLKMRIEVADIHMKDHVLKEYEEVQKRVQKALAGSKSSV